MCYTINIGDNMKKTIHINLKSESDLIDKYNQNIVSMDLIEYILEQTHYINKKDELNVVIDKEFDTDTIGLIKTGLRNEELKIIKQNRYDNIRQIIFLLLGIICLTAYVFLDNIEVLSEILLIGGWILIGEAIEIQLFSDSQANRNKMIIKKILKSDFIENKKNKSL